MIAIIALVKPNNVFKYCVINIIIMENLYIPVSRVRPLPTGCTCATTHV